MSEWVGPALDILLIVLIGAGLVQVTRLIGHLSGLKSSRAEMEKFVHEFGSTVTRAENGIKALKQAARDTGDDLEPLLEKSIGVRDELKFIIESADKLAERLTVVASAAVREPPKPKVEVKAELKIEKSAPKIEASKIEMPQVETPSVAQFGRKNEAPQPASRAEKELLQALQKLK